MIHVVLGKKIGQSQRFLEDGTRIPVTLLAVPDAPVIQVKTREKDGYTSLQLGFGKTRKTTKGITGHAKKASLSYVPSLLKEVRLASETSLPEPGSFIKVEEVFEKGDMVKVTGMSKGKGFAGGVKRHQFKGGPRTHGQSDRERAPGSIGQATTPGRVYKGKRMAGRMGHETVTVSNLWVSDILTNGEKMLLLSGLVPGSLNSILTIEKTGKKKKFVPLYKTEAEKQSEEATLHSQEQIPAEVKEDVKEEIEVEKVEKAENEEVEPQAASGEPKIEIKEEVKNGDKE